MDTEQFSAPPLTTGGLKAHYNVYGKHSDECSIELVHFLAPEDITNWLQNDWRSTVRPLAESAVAAGATPVFGFSCYTWNVAEFLEIAALVKSTVPQATIIAGGPHVQRAEDFLGVDSIDLIVLGEGEETFTQFLDCTGPDALSDISGLAFLDGGDVVKTPTRPRTTELDAYPSALDVVPLRAADGAPLYTHAAYETSRGCPFLCAFCEWGTGAIGTKMYQFSLERIRSDLERLVEGGVHDIWFSDSNFGALREDEAKAEMLVELRERTGLPNSFSTSWSKHHGPRVQRIVRMLFRAELLWQYHLALQTLTPLALELSNRKNMRANDYEPIVKSLAADGVPVAAELIWGLPGDTLAEFEQNLEHLMTVFPSIHIFAYTLLPGTEFFEKREEYRLETLPVAGYGKAKGEYVVGCHTFDRAEGEEGYAMLAAYLVLARGQIMARTIRFLALSEKTRVIPLLKEVMSALQSALHLSYAPMDVYENRSDMYVELLTDTDRTYRVVRSVVETWLSNNDVSADFTADTLRVLEVDEIFCPRSGPARIVSRDFDFDAAGVHAALSRVELPAAEALSARNPVRVNVDHPAHAGEVLRDPDGGEWMRGRIVSGTDETAVEAATPQ
jgi:radical SAM superfamily enzyme YgiQ (UPF0313 family)